MFIPQMKWAWVFPVLIYQGLSGQSPNQTDTLHSGTTPIDLRFELPVGQFFISSPSPIALVSTLNAYGSQHIPQKQTGALQNRRLVAFVPQQASDKAKQMTTNSSGSFFSYRLNPNSNEKPEDLLWEFFPDATQTFNLHLKSGHGSTRLDLSGLSISGLEVSNGNSNLFISYSRPNKIEMEHLKINGGMGRIVIRNLEMAKAKTVVIQNGMGETQISIGNACAGAQYIQIEAGAGSCIVMIDPSIPVKISLTQGLFGKINIPQNFTQKSPGQFQNAAFDKNPQQGIVFSVDVGLGNFTLLPSGK